MHPSIVESTLLLLTLGALLAVYFRLHSRQRRIGPPAGGLTEWIDGKLQPPTEKAAKLFGQASWLIVYHKYNNSPDGEEAICRAVTWAFCRGRTIEPVKRGQTVAKDPGASDLSGTLVICQQRHSFLAMNTYTQSQNS